MNKKHTTQSSSGIIIILLCLFFINANAQINCNPGVFYGWGSDGSIHELTLSGNAISLGTAVSSAATVSRFGLAIADTGGGNLFYSCGATSLALDYDIMYYNAGSWTTVFYNPYPNSLHNAAGKGNFLYYQYIGSSTQTGLARHSKIFRYTSNSLPVVFMDTTVFMKVADIAVDNTGNIYFFSDSIPFPDTNVSRLNIISPAGNLLASYPCSFDGDNAYGCFIDDSTIYVGLGPSNLTHPNTLLPITIAGNSTVIGAPIAMPFPIIGGTIGNPTHLQFSDLASCANASIHFEHTPASLIDPSSDDEISFFPNPVHNQLNFHCKEITGGEINIYDSMGRMIISQKITANNILVDFSNLPPGLFMIETKTEGLSYFQKVIHN